MYDLWQWKPTSKLFNPESNADLGVETTDLPSPSAKEPSNEKGMCVETGKFALKECSVKLKSLESILFPTRRSGCKNKNKNNTYDTTPKSKPEPVPQQAKVD